MRPTWLALTCLRPLQKRAQARGPASAPKHLLLEALRLVGSYGKARPERNAAFPRGTEHYPFPISHFHASRCCGSSCYATTLNGGIMIQK